MIDVQKLLESILLSAIWLAVSTQAVSAGVQYSLTGLGYLPGYTSFSNAMGINNNGQVVGYCFSSSGEYCEAFAYSNGTMQGLGTLPDYAWESTAVGINDIGQIVGTSLEGPGSYEAFLTSNGTMQYIGTLPGYTDADSATGINASGQIVGFALVGDKIGAYLLSNGSFQALGTLPGYVISEAFAINASGEIVGYLSNPSSINSGASEAFLYTGGTMQGLGTLSGYTAASYARGVNDQGQVVGLSMNSTGYQQAFLYSGGTMQSLGLFPGYEGDWADGINDAGQIVGSAWGPNGTSAFLYEDGTLENLNNLIDPSLGWTLSKARAININGQIVGDGINPNGQVEAFLLTPVPEPTSLALLAVGAGCFAGLSSRRPKPMKATVGLDRTQTTVRKLPRN